MCPNKSLILECPIIPTQFIPDFVRGCWDGDGTLGLYRGFSKTQGYETIRRSCALFTGSKVFAEGLQKLLTEQDIKSNVWVKKTKPRKIGDRLITSTRELYSLNISAKSDIFKFCQKIYYQNNLLSLKRKELIAKSLAKNCTPKFG